MVLDKANGFRLQSDESFGSCHAAALWFVAHVDHARPALSIEVRESHCVLLPVAIGALAANGVEQNIAAPSSRRLVRHRPAEGAIDAVLSYRKRAGIEKAGKDPAIACHPQSIAAIAGT
jgi:hypothetical protein